MTDYSHELKYTFCLQLCGAVVGKEVAVNYETFFLLRSKHCLTELDSCSHLSVSKVVSISSSSVGAAMKTFTRLPVYFQHS